MTIKTETQSEPAALNYTLKKKKKKKTAQFQDPLQCKSQVCQTQVELRFGHTEDRNN